MKKILCASVVATGLLLGDFSGVSAEEVVVESLVEENNDLRGITPHYIPTYINMTPRNETIKGATKTIPFKLSFGGDYGVKGYQWGFSPGTGERYSGTTTFTSIVRNHTYQLSPGQMTDTYSTSASVVGVSSDNITGKITHKR